MAWNFEIRLNVLNLFLRDRLYYYKRWRVSKMTMLSQLISDMFTLLFIFLVTVLYFVYKTLEFTHLDEWDPGKFLIVSTNQADLSSLIKSTLCWFSHSLSFSALTHINICVYTIFSLYLGTSAYYYYISHIAPGISHLLNWTVCLKWTFF